MVRAALLLAVLLTMTAADAREPVPVLHADEPGPVFIDGKRFTGKWRCESRKGCTIKLPASGVRRVQGYPDETFGKVSDSRGREDFELGVAPLVPLLPGASLGVDLEGGMHGSEGAWCFTVEKSSRLETYECGGTEELTPGRVYGPSACARPAMVSTFTFSSSSLPTNQRVFANFIVTVPGLYRFRVTDKGTELVVDRKADCAGDGGTR